MLGPAAMELDHDLLSLWSACTQVAAELQALQADQAGLKAENARLGASEAELAPLRAALREAQEQAASSRAEASSADASVSSQMASISRERDGLLEQVWPAGVCTARPSGPPSLQGMLTYLALNTLVGN